MVDLTELDVDSCSTLEILEAAAENLTDLTINNPRGDFSLNALLLEKLGRFEKLKSLRLEQIYIGDFDISWLRNHPNLLCLQLISCDLRTIKFNRDLCVSESQQPVLPPRLERLSLERNCIESVSRDMFREFSSLKSLDLSINKIESQDRVTRSSLPISLA